MNIMEQKVTQKSLILGHLKQYGTIEPLTALREYGAYRLGAIIFDLRKEGYNITTEIMDARSRITGRPVMFAKYTLVSDEKTLQNEE
jgi:hypothetical protein